MGPLDVPLSVFLLQICALQGVLKFDLPVLWVFPIGGAFNPTGGEGWVQPPLPQGLISTGEGGCLALNNLRCSPLALPVPS